MCCVKLPLEAAEQVVEVYAAIVGASVGIAGASGLNMLDRSSKGQASLIRLTVAVENMSDRLEELHVDMKADRKEMYGQLAQHETRLTKLEGRATQISG